MKPPLKKLKVGRVEGQTLLVVLGEGGPYHHKKKKSKDLTHLGGGEVVSATTIATLERERGSKSISGKKMCREGEQSRCFQVTREREWGILNRKIKVNRRHEQNFKKEKKNEKKKRVRKS